MAIAGYKPSSEPIVTPTLPTVEPKNYQSIIYDDNNVPLHSLLAYAEGAPWTTNYYSQVISEHTDLRELDTGQPNVFQQYKRVNDLEIRVESPISASYDEATGITTATGSALMYPFLIPNVHDYFTSDAGDNRTGLFRVTSINRKTLGRDSLFLVDYVLVGYVEVLTELYGELKSKVTSEYFFSRDRLIEGLNPMLRTEDRDTVVSLKYELRATLEYYFSNFYSRRYQTLVIPGQPSPVYDAYLVNYLTKIVDSSMVDELRQLRTLPSDNDIYMSQNQFWDMMLNKDYRALSQLNKRMGLVSKYVFNKNSYLHGIAYSNIEFIVYPTEVDNSKTVDTGNIYEFTPDAELVEEVTSYDGTLAELINNTYNNGTTTYRLVDLVTVDSYYVLSANFYNNTTDANVLEILTRDYLKGSTIDTNMLTALIDDFRNWGRVEQFYYGPIIITLIKEANRRSY